MTRGEAYLTSSYPKLSKLVTFFAFYQNQFDGSLANVFPNGPIEFTESLFISLRFGTRPARKRASDVFKGIISQRHAMKPLLIEHAAQIMLQESKGELN
jgi:hypothetical protein